MKVKRETLSLAVLCLCFSLSGCFRPSDGSIALKMGQYVATEPIKSSQDSRRRLYYSYSIHGDGWAYITVVDEGGADAVSGHGSFAEYRRSGSGVSFYPLPQSEEAGGIFEVPSVTILSETTLLQDRTGDKLRYRGPVLVTKPTGPPAPR
jgi:hypothetical protein